jgi:hypothetical protein
MRSLAVSFDKRVDRYNHSGGADSIVCPLTLSFTKRESIDFHMSVSLWILGSHIATKAPNAISISIGV